MDASLGRGGGGGDGSGASNEAIEALQRQVQEMHVDLADVSNRMKDNTQLVNATLKNNISEGKKMEETMVKAIEVRRCGVGTRLTHELERHLLSNA